MLFTTLLYNKEIEKSIKENINAISKSSDWSQFELFLNGDNLDLSNRRYVEVIVQRDIYENIAKLSVDIWRDYHYYKQFGFESKYDNEEYKAKLVELEFVCDNGRWQCGRKPRFEIVAKNVFAYCILQRMYINMDVSEDVCIFCDASLIGITDTCVCGASVTERNSLRENFNKSKMGRKSNSNLSSNEGSTNDEELLREVFPPKADKNDNTHDPSRSNGDGDIPVPKEYWKSTSTWKCGKCAYLSEYSFVNCKACGDIYTNGQWLCDKCKIENLSSNEECVGCYERNIHLPKVIVRSQSANDESRRPLKMPTNSTSKDHWKCGHCGLFCGYTLVKCSVCGDDFKNGKWICHKCGLENKCLDSDCVLCHKRNVMLPKEIVVKQTKNDERMCDKCGKLRRSNTEECSLCFPKEQRPALSKVRWECRKCKRRQFYGSDKCCLCAEMRAEVGEWDCSKCTCTNKFPTMECSACEEPNKYSKLKFCQYCMRNNEGDCEDEEIGNYAIAADLEFCPKCNLSIHHSANPGEDCQELYKGKPRTVWICSQCHMINAADNKKCKAKKCAEPRPGKKESPPNTIRGAEASSNSKLKTKK